MPSLLRIGVFFFSGMFMTAHAEAQSPIRGRAAKLPPNEMLAKAACEGQLDRVRDALKLGGSANGAGEAYDAAGTALFLNAVCPKGNALAEGERVPIANLLLESGASLNQGGKLLFPGAQVPMASHIAAAYTNRPELMAFLLDKGASAEEGDLARDGSALIWAAEGSCTQCVPLLLQRGASLERRNRMGLTALFVAAARGDTNMVAALLKEGANPFVKESMGRDIIDAVRNSHVKKQLEAARRRVLITYAAAGLSVLFLIGTAIFFAVRREEPAA